MKDLSKIKTNWNPFIERELVRARIPKETTTVRGIGNATIIGKLSGLVFKRGTHYWVVEGAVPMTLALKLQDDPVGDEDIRVAGRAGGPRPDAWLSITEWAELSEAAYSEMFNSLEGPTGHVERIAFEKADELLKASVAAKDWDKLVVWNCHIHTEVGLRLFADTLKA